MKPMDNPIEHTHECLFSVFHPEWACMQSPVAIFCKKSIKLVLNVRKTWYHERPSSQITPIIIVQQIMRFKTVASFYRFLGKLVQDSRLSSAYLWYCFWPWWIVWDICRNKVRFNNLIQMHLSTYSEVLFNVEYQGVGFLGISICPVGMISKRATWVVMSIFVCPHQSFYLFLYFSEQTYSEVTLSFRSPTATIRRELFLLVIKFILQEIL